MELKYYVIGQSEDGLTLREYDTVGDVEHGLSLHDEDIRADCRPSFLGRCPRVVDGQFAELPERATLIIKGEIIQPKPRKHVIEWDWS